MELLEKIKNSDDVAYLEMDEKDSQGEQMEFEQLILPMIMSR